MVVDDDPVIGKLLTRFLTEENYEVTSFTSGKDALDYLKSQIPPNPIKSPHPPFAKGEKGGLEIRGDFACGVDLLLTDMQMPEMSGIELARQAKILYPALPIIVMSGSADGRARDEIFALGADFIAKPFDLVDLLKRIQQAVQSLKGKEVIC